MIGSMISQYRILEKLGEGGMGVVYKAQDTRLDRPVALKFLPPHLHASEADKARFLQEAKAAAALNHPNICSVIDVQEVEGASPGERQIFIVMEFIDGQTLAEKKGTVSLKQAVEIGVQVADGLAAAHERGIVHRDIKPENIMVRKDGIVQIMDFGLAKLRATRVTRLTREGSTVGTAGFMSPEQVQGQDVDHRSDIFSLGVLLYELITGELPFKGVHETALLYEIVNVEAAPMSTIKPGIDPELDRIVLECLAKEPSERYQSAAEVAKDLRRFKRESGRQRTSRISDIAAADRQSAVAGATMQPADRTGTRNGRPRGQVILLAVSGILGVAVLVLLWALWREGGVPAQPVVRFSFNVSWSPTRLQGSSGVAISPDGKYIAWMGSQGGTSQLMLRPIDQMTLQPVPGTEGAIDPFFSADGQWIAVQLGGKLKKFSVFGGSAQDICDIQGLIRGGWWTSDNTIFFGTISSGIMRVSANGGTPELVTTLDTAGTEISHRFPQVLPDGKTLIFTVKQSNISSFNEAFICAQRIGTPERKTLIRGGTYAQYLPTGHLMYARGKSLFVVPLDAGKLEVKGPPVAMLDGGMLNEFSGSANFGCSTTGIFVYALAESAIYNRFVISWMDRKGKIFPLIETPRSYAGGALSPDGQKLAVVIEAANDDIWIYNLRGGALTRLTFEGGNHGSPVWSPDGKFIYYAAEHGKSANIYRKSGDGSGTEQRLTQSPETQLPSSCSPDGKTLAFIQNADIWTLPLTGESTPSPFIQSPAVEEQTDFSPDGKWMAYASNESGRREIYVVPFPKQGGKWQISTNGGSNPRWSHDGRELFFVSGTALMAVGVTLTPTFEFSPPQKLCDAPAGVIGVGSVAPDGKRFVVGVDRSPESSSTQLSVVVGWLEELRAKMRSAKE